MDEVGIIEYVKGDNRKFEIWYVGKEEVYIVQVSYLKIIVEIIICIKIRKFEFVNKNYFGYIIKVFIFFMLVI